MTEVAYPLPRRRRAALPFHRRRRGRALEAFVVALIVGIVIYEALLSFRAVAAKTWMLNAISLASIERAEAVTAMAAAGELPDRLVERPVRASTGARGFGPPEWRDGELVFPATERLLRLLRDERDEAAVGDTGEATRRAPGEASGDDSALAFRLARAPVSGATVWLCGRESAPAGFEAAPPTRTTIPSAYLPHFCR